jgi:hypothetical protein
MINDAKEEDKQKNRLNKRKQQSLEKMQLRQKIKVKFHLCLYKLQKKVLREELSNKEASNQIG